MDRLFLYVLGLVGLAHLAAEYCCDLIIFNIGGATWELQLAAFLTNRFPDFDVRIILKYL